MYLTNWHFTAGQNCGQEAKDSGEQRLAMVWLEEGQVARQLEASGSALYNLYSASLQVLRERAMVRNHTATST